MAFGNTSELPDSQIEYRDTNGGRRWVALLIYIVLALAVATLVVFAGRWVYHRVSNNSGPTPTTISPQNTKKGATTPKPSPAPTSKAPATTSKPAPAPAPTPAPSAGTNKSSGTATPAPTPAPSPTSLQNTGPGEIIALFIGTSFVAGFLHFTVKLRKIAKSI